VKVHDGCIAQFETYIVTPAMLAALKPEPGAGHGLALVDPSIEPEIEMTDLTIANNRASSRFEIIVHGKLARLDYRVEQGTIFLDYVEVPQDAQGRGIAGALAHAALKFSRDSGLKAVAHCSFIAAYMRGHPEE
jgi:hypothetical protein